MNELGANEFYESNDEEIIEIVSHDGESIPSEVVEAPLLSNHLKFPISLQRDEIIDAVKNNQFVIIHGETGCGKTTQVPQYLYREGLHENRIIGITEPRKLAAISMAKRVSNEMQETLGKTVGYEVRFDRKYGASTKIKYMTDGILLNECVTDKRLNDYQIIMIDEVHERTVITDVLLGLLKRITTKRPDLKVIISSATIAVDKFITYFEKAKVVYVESRLYPVNVIYHDYLTNYIDKIEELVRKISIEESKARDRDFLGQSDILVFLPGQEEIYTCCELLKTIENVVSKPLCSAIDRKSMNSIFVPVSPWQIKVVVATNIAETSLTIEGIKYVIDCGYVKQNHFDAQRCIEVLEEVRISKAQADQRKGRAGRTQPGVCHRLYTEDKFQSFEDEAIPEIRRKNLTEIYIRVKAFDLNPEEFNFFEAPKLNELERSAKELFELSLLTSEGDLTELGRQISHIPLHPILGKVLMTSLEYKCTTDVIRIVSMLTEKIQNIFKRPRDQEKQADCKRLKFDHTAGDHFTLLNVYNAWKAERNRYKWCERNYINAYIMDDVENTIRQIHYILKRSNIKIEVETENNNIENIKRCFIAGYFRNICTLQPQDVYIRWFGQEVFFIYGNSSLKNSKPKIILFHNAQKSRKLFASGVMQLDEDPLRKLFKKELDIIHFPDDVNKVLSYFD